MNKTFKFKPYNLRKRKPENKEKLESPKTIKKNQAELLTGELKRIKETTELQQKVLKSQKGINKILKIESEQLEKSNETQNEELKVLKRILQTVKETLVNENEEKL